MSPSASEAQSASIQASVRVLAPTVQPSVRLLASGVAGREPTVVVEGTESWAVSVQVGAEEFALAPERGGAGRLELTASECATLAREPGSAPVSVRVVLAAY